MHRGINPNNIVLDIPKRGAQHPGGYCTTQHAQHATSAATNSSAAGGFSRLDRTPQHAEPKRSSSELCDIDHAVVRLVDFGGMQDVYVDAETQSFGSDNDSSAGYTPPEQREGAATTASDMWAFGGVLL